MYGFDWANEKLWLDEGRATAMAASQLDRDLVERTLLLHWEEHCIECAPPDCYAACPLYVARADRKCARFVYGVQPNPSFAGLFDVGADLRFRRWGKLEAIVGGPALSLRAHRRAASTDRTLTSVARALVPVDRNRRAGAALSLVRDRVLPKMRGARDVDFDEFVLECHAPDDEPFRLILEWAPHDRVAFRHAFEIEPGHNFHSLPADRFGPLEEAAGGRLRVYPENDAERRLVFTWLDFVRYRERPASIAEPGGPADLVKCVAWDLDGTLWYGTLIEDGPDRPLREGVAELVRALDERGILQTVVSKNDHDEAWAVVERLGLAEYFLYPQISWEPKSAAVRRAAERLDIGLDTFVFVDDSDFERAEVRQALPMVRVVGVDALAGLLDRPELAVPVTDAARGRRLQYRTRIEREDAAEAFSGDYLEFLRSCRLQLRVVEPREPAQFERCLELVQRSNQLNLSKRGYSREQFEDLLRTSGVAALALEAEDRFGNYGLIGFVAVDERGEVPLVRDYVLSCRVAQKRVEHAFFGWLADHERGRGASRLRAELVRSNRNGPLERVFEDLPFARVDDDGTRVVFELELPATPWDDVVSVRDLVAT